MEKGFAPVARTQKSKNQSNLTQAISIEHLQASLSTYFDNIPDNLGRQNQTTLT